MGALLKEIMATYYCILAAIGVPGNNVVMVILSRGKCGLSKCVTRYLVAMAAADLLVVVTDVIVRCIINIYIPTSFLTITPMCNLTTALIFAATETSVWFTVLFTFDRFVAICCQKMKPKYCTEKTAAVVIGIVSIFSCLQNIPWYFVGEPEYFVKNVPHSCRANVIFFTSPAWATFELLHLILTPFVPFILILMLNAITVRHIFAANRVRKGFLNGNNGVKQKDGETDNRKKSIVLLFSISGTFILLWSTEFVYLISLHVNKSEYVLANDLESVAIMLQMLSTCTNACIYGVTQRKFREELKNAMKYPLHLISKLFK